MSLQKNLVLLLLLLVSIQAQPNQRARCQVRREWDSLNPLDKQLFIDGLQCLFNQRSLNQTTPTLSIYEDFVYHHMIIAPSVHFTPLFLPFHRLFIFAFETALQRCNPGRFANVTIPYWDVAVNAENFAAFSGFSNQYFGGNGSSDGCVVNGVAAGRIATYPTTHCLSRAFDYNLISEFAREELALGRLFAANPSGTFNLFRTQLETTLHAGVHFGIGGIDRGDMAAAATATNDPLFWLHHSNIDRIWKEWQNSFPNLANTYDGLNEFNGTVTEQDLIDLGLLRTLVPFDAAYQIRVSDSFSFCGPDQYALSGNISTGVWVQKTVSDMAMSKIS